MIFEESSDISFVGNSAASYGGAISIVDSNVTIYGRVLFENNSAGTDGGATFSLNGVISMTGIVDFNKNSAQRGGAMAFIGFSSKLRLIEPLIANSAENSAILGGGAIFYQDDTSIDKICYGSDELSRDCFIELSSRVNIRLIFDNNNAATGRVFYGGYLDTCTPLVGGMHSDGERLLDTIIASISNVRVNISKRKMYQMFHLTQFRCASAKVTNLYAIVQKLRQLEEEISHYRL